MKRQIDRYLQAWKEDQERKVLLLRGARQVGKTYCVRRLAETFETFMEINFEEDPRLISFFEGALNPSEINQKLIAYCDLRNHLKCKLRSERFRHYF